MKWTLLFFLSLLSISLFAANASSKCEFASLPHEPTFCTTFKAAAVCRCVETGLPSGKCQNMDTLYRLMLLRFGTVQRACEYQKETPVQTCLDSWSCFRDGGKDSQGRLCSATGNRCNI